MLITNQRVPIIQVTCSIQIRNIYVNQTLPFEDNFIQIIWKATEHIGAARFLWKNKCFAVVLYYPAAKYYYPDELGQNIKPPGQPFFPF
jgi:hypothetical protein